MTTNRIAMKALPLGLVVLGIFLGLVPALLATPVLAQQVSREQDIVALRLGQRILVDDGSCPAGQIKEVSGAKMTPTGVLRSSKCIPRLGLKKR